jgi:hypothetical protein
MKVLREFDDFVIRSFCKMLILHIKCGHTGHIYKEQGLKEVTIEVTLR